MTRPTMLEVMMFVAGVVAALLLAAAMSVALAERCESRPAVGGGVIASCREPGSAAPPRQFITRPAIGGGTLTTGGGREAAAPDHVDTFWVVR